MNFRELGRAKLGRELEREIRDLHRERKGDGESFWEDFGEFGRERKLRKSVIIRKRLREFSVKR